MLVRAYRPLDRPGGNHTIPSQFHTRNRSVWCDRCGDCIVQAADPLTRVLLGEHRRFCTGRMGHTLRSNGWWMGGPRPERRR
jgi:hypothetical protein